MKQWKKKVTIAIAITEFVLLLILGIIFLIFYNSMYKRTLILEENSKDGIYQIALYEIGETYPFGSTTVEVVARMKDPDKESGWKGAICYTIDVYETKFLFEWIDEGVIIHEKQSEDSNISYRIYWDDVFKE